MSAVKRKVGPLALALSLAVVLLALPAAAAWDAGGRWLIEGTGYGEKSPVRLRLALNGYMDVKTATSGDVRFITGYDLNMRLDTSRAGVKTWTEEIHETLHVPVPLPSLAPTVNEPFRLPAVSRTSMSHVGDGGHLRDDRLGRSGPDGGQLQERRLEGGHQAAGPGRRSQQRLQRGDAVPRLGASGAARRRPPQAAVDRRVGRTSDCGQRPRGRAPRIFLAFFGPFVYNYRDMA